MTNLVYFRKEASFPYSNQEFEMKDYLPGKSIKLFSGVTAPVLQVGKNGISERSLMQLSEPEFPMLICKS